jgi:acetolactate synthase-1/2/3 large subunit
VSPSPLRKVSDVVASFLRDRGVRNVYLVSGGGMMHLLDSVGREPALRYVCNHHEQASAIAAEAESHLTGRTAVCLVTTGPGATNALSGVVGAWYDSIPMLVISGQVRTQLLADYAHVRQLGPQEVDIGGMARAVTKYFVTVRDPLRIRYELERAWYEARAGRPGPAWIDVPLDVSAAMVDESTLVGFDPPASASAIDEGELEAVVEALAKAERPVVYAGHGVRLAGAVDALQAFVERFELPTVVSYGGADLLPETHPFFFGRVGPIGQRRANFVLQTSDLVLSIGASLSYASLGFATEKLAPRARKIAVNVDRGEHDKRTVALDRAITADAAAFLAAMRAHAPSAPPARAAWIEACREWKARYPPLTPAYFEDHAHANSYVLGATLAEQLGEGEVVLTGNSLDWCSLYQTFATKPGQRLFTNLNYGAMGWDLPAAIGACCGRDGRVVLLTGDGGIQTNVHELGTIGHNRLPIKIFVLSNDGYQSIRATQDNFFEGFHVGSSERTGVGVPDFASLAAAYRLPYSRIRTNAEMKDGVAAVLASDGPALCEVMLDPKQERIPRLKSWRRDDGTMASPALEDMYPPLPRTEIEAILGRFGGGER